MAVIAEKYREHGGVRFLWRSLKWFKKRPRDTTETFLEEIGILEPKTFDSLSPPIWLNLGAGTHQVEGYTPVDIDPLSAHAVIQHDITDPIPLPDDSVERILTEHTLEHLHADEILSVLNECHRLLQSGGFMRVAVPDYDNPNERTYLEQGHDPRWPDHKTLPHYELMKRLIEESNFTEYDFRHYWLDDVFHMEPIDYSRGYIRRTPDNSRRNRDGVPRPERSLVVDLLVD